MRKREFMDELKKALDGNVSTQTYYDTINYYEDYFKKQKEACLLYTSDAADE